jgi:hypothetical protein
MMIRGIERRKIFRDDDDHQDMLDRLATLLPETGTVCYAWAFLDNHAHFLFRSGPRGIAVLMRRLPTGYVIGFNRRHRRCGQLFQNGILIGFRPEPRRFSMCRSQMCCAAGIGGPLRAPAAGPATGRCERWACRRPSWRGVSV